VFVSPPTSQGPGGNGISGGKARKTRKVRGGCVDDLSPSEIVHKLKVLRGIRQAGNGSPRITKEIKQLEAIL
jgi:hypothetical protein